MITCLKDEQDKINEEVGRNDIPKQRSQGYRSAVFLFTPPEGLHQLEIHEESKIRDPRPRYVQRYNGSQRGKSSEIARGITDLF